MITALLFLSIALASNLEASDAVSVTQCGADPSGKADSAQAFISCLKSTPTGNVLIPAGTYRISRTIVKNRNQNLMGAGSKASTLLCEMQNSPCILVGDTSGGINNYNTSRIQDLTLQGPGQKGSNIGVYFGGDPSGHFNSPDAYADGANLIDVRVIGFQHGIQWGNNAWGNKLVRAFVFGNASGLYVEAGVRNSGENVGLTDTSVFNNQDFGLEDHGNFEWMISGTAFDYNGTAIEFFGAAVHAINCHFEQAAAQVIFQPYGQGILSIKDSEILVQANTGLDAYILNTWPQSLNISIDDVSIWSNHPVKYFMRVQGSVNGSINNLHGNGNRMIKAIANSSSKAVMSGNTAF